MLQICAIAYLGDKKIIYTKNAVENLLRKLPGSIVLLKISFKILPK